MKNLSVMVVASLWASIACSAALFSKPDCSAFAALLDGEASCLAEHRRETNREFNAAQIRAAGLEFRHLARPPAGEAFDTAYPEAKAALENKIEGAFELTFSVNKKGEVEAVAIREVSAEPMRALAQVWVDTLSKWQFVRPDKPVKNVIYRRVYFYAEDDSDSADQE